MKIAFIYYGDSTIVEQDYNILSKQFEVRKVRFNGIKSIYDIYKAIRWADVSFSWFADVWSFIAVVFSKLFRKKSVVIVGGYDVECVKEIGYGICTKPFWRRWMRTYALNHATLLLPVSEYTKTKIHSYLKYPRDIEVVYNAVDTNFFVPKGIKENIVLTVASGGNNDIIALKGLETFVKAAKYVPDAEFVVVGLTQKDRHILSKMNSSDNVKLIGKLTQHELLQWYQRAKVYCQLSKVESFGMSLAEAMSCGCVPVTTFVGGLVEIGGRIGFHVTINCDVKDNVKAIRSALEWNMLIGEKTIILPREYIQKNFSIEQREEKLVQVLGDM